MYIYTIRRFSKGVDAAPQEQAAHVQHNLRHLLHPGLQRLHHVPEQIHRGSVPQEHRKRHGHHRAHYAVRHGGRLPNLRHCHLQEEALAEDSSLLERRRWRRLYARSVLVLIPNVPRWHYAPGGGASESVHGMQQPMSLRWSTVQSHLPGGNGNHVLLRLSRWM